MWLFGLPFPEEYGGMGGYFALALALEELGKVDQSVAITLEAGVSPAARALAGFGLTEPGGGSDAGATRTTAPLEGGEWVVNGD
jgi:short/branched chain acyl-CoA dehydrogenase